MFNLLDRFAAGYSILIAVLLESIAVSWIYGKGNKEAQPKDHQLIE